jgi:hypothetical protein
VQAVELRKSLKPDEAAYPFIYPAPPFEDYA